MYFILSLIPEIAIVVIITDSGTHELNLSYKFAVIQWPTSEYKNQGLLVQSIVGSTM